jgi:hypothetical protein
MGLSCRLLKRTQPQAIRHKPNEHGEYSRLVLFTSSTDRFLLVFALSWKRKIVLRLTQNISASFSIDDGDTTMNTWHTITKTAAFLAVCAVYQGVAVADASPAQVQLANAYISQLTADNNHYGSPASIAYNQASQLVATTKCSSFTALLLINSHPNVNVSGALNNITSNSLPYADQWYTAIQQEASDANTGLAFHQRPTVASLQPGDIIASAYTTTGNTGHTMTVAELPQQANIQPPAPIPGVSVVNAYIIQVFDSAITGHTPPDSAKPYYRPDSRYQKQWDSTAQKWVWDDGIGSGYIVIYEDATNGKPVAWAWSTGKTKSFYYAVTPPTGSTYEYRPLELGYLSGL